jgi:hypothetical protein
MFVAFNILQIFVHSERILKFMIQGVLKMAHNIYVTRIYVEYKTKNSNSNLVLDEYFLNYYYYQK